MKFRNLKYMALFFASMGILTSCEDFLDRQEDEVLTFDKIWNKKTTTQQYFYTAMSGMPDYNNASTVKPWFGASDEGSVSFAGNASLDLIYGKWNSSSYAGEYASLYKSIRECNIFLANIDKCNDPYLLEDEKESWRYSVKWARAYYYFLLMRCYGPVILLYDEIPDPTYPDMEEKARARNTWDECVNYLTQELNDIIESGALDYNDWESYDDRKGLPTTGAARALLSRLKLYAARPLFNGCNYYKDVKNNDGTFIFPQSVDNNKWKEAADAAYDLITNEHYQIYKSESNNPYANWKELNISGSSWRSEVIYGFYNTCNYWARRATPSVQELKGYGGVGPTQEQVDAFAMSNGRFPIIDYKSDGSPVIDTKSGYTEEGMMDFENPYLKWKNAPAKYRKSCDGLGWPKMFYNREPRFYMSVFWSNSYWVYNKNKAFAVSMAKDGNAYSSHNYSLTGYTMIKYVDSDYDHSNNKYNSTVYSHFRLAEIYLNFIEAVLECKKNGVDIPDEYLTKAFECWDELRDRVNIPRIKEAYNEVQADDYDKWIDLCRRERRVELLAENHRFFDNRTWMTSEECDGGILHGMNIQALAPNGTTTPEEFWQRTPLQERIFEKKYYLYPIPQGSIRKNSELVQNKGW